MLVGYFDESGTHSDSKVMGVGGFVADSHAWKKVRQHWRPVLQKYGVTHFHATDLESRKGIYLGWSIEKQIGFQKELTAVIRDRLPASLAFGVSHCVILEAYDRLVPIGSALRDVLGSPYNFLGYQCISRVLDWAETNQRPGPIEFIFESGGPAVGELTTTFYAVKPLKDCAMGELGFGDKKRTIELQVADLHAYEAYKHSDNREVEGVKRDVRKSLKAILSPGGNVRGWSLNQEKLAAFVPAAEKLLAELESPTSGHE